MITILKRLCIFALLILFSSCSSIFDSVNNQNAIKKEPRYMVATLLPLTGKYESIGNSILDSINLSYSQNTNKNIVLKVYDTKGDPNTALLQANLAIEDGAKAIIGPLLGEEAKAVATSTTAQKIPVFTLSNDIDLVKSTDNLYSLSFLPTIELEAVINYAYIRKGSRNFAILYPDNKYGTSMFIAAQSAIATHKNGNLVRSVKYSASSPKILYNIQQLIPSKELYKYITINQKINNNQEVLDKNGKPLTRAPAPKLDFDTLIIADFGQRLPVVTSHLPPMDITYKNLIILGINAWDEPANLNDVVLQQSYIASYNIDETSNFYHTFVNYFNKPPTLIDIASYDTTALVMSLVYRDNEHNLVSDFTKEKILEYKGQGASNNMSIDTNKIVTRPIIIKQLNKGSFVTIK